MLLFGCFKLSFQINHCSSFFFSVPILIFYRVLIFFFVLCCPTPATAKWKLKALVENSELVEEQLEKVTPIKNADQYLTLYE